MIEKLRYASSVIQKTQKPVTLRGEGTTDGDKGLTIQKEQREKRQNKYLSQEGKTNPDHDDEREADAEESAENALSGETSEESKPTSIDIRA